MTIWIDNDGCPRVIRDLVVNGAVRIKHPLVVVGNTWMRMPEHAMITMTVVKGGFDAVDDRIAQDAQASDLVITADVPLASRIIAKGALALSPHGELFDQKNIAERLAMRNLMQELRSAGDIKGGKGAFGALDKKRFADAYDRLLAIMEKRRL